MAQYFEDFEDAPLGIGLPSVLSASGVAAETGVEAADWASNGKVLRYKGAGGRTFTWFNSFPSDVLDYDIIMAYRETGTDGATKDARVMGRHIAQSDAILSGKDNSTENVGIQTLVGGSFSNLATTSSTAIPLGTTIFVRSNVSGDMARVKRWAGALTDEPAGWDLEFSGLAVSDPGQAGWFSFGGTPLWLLDWYGLGTDGDPAPTEAPGPGGEGVTVNPPAAETESQAIAPAVTSGASVFPATAITESLAYAPSVTTGASVSPPVSDTIAQAYAPKVATGASVSPTVAATDSAANDPLVSSGAAARPPTAATESEAHAPVIATGASVAPPPAFTDSQAHDPSVGSVVIVQPPAAITESLAHDPIISTGVSVFPVSAETVESANDPAVSSGASVLAPAAITVTDAHDPTVSAGILPFVRKVTIRGTMTRKVTLSGNMNRKASIPGTLTRKVRL